MVRLLSTRVINSVTLILLLSALVGTADADSVTPPDSITICGYVTYANEIGIWWFNPYDPDFGGVQMWLDDEYLGTTEAGDHFYNAYSSVIGTHTFSTHTFDNSGNVNLTWVNLTFRTKEYPGCTENWTCDTCSRPTSPIAAFSANETSGIVPLTVLFNDNSTNAPTEWNWSFGDGNYSAIQNPEYMFTRGGSYSITLNVSNIAGHNSTTKFDYITVIPQSPIASFTSNVTKGLIPLDVRFTDTSENFPTMWNWSFGDNSWFNTTDSSLSNVTKSYHSGGNYTITLYVSNSGGSDSVSHFIDVWNQTTNDFAANITSGNVTFPVLFTDISYDATKWFWIFDGTNTSTSQNPVFEYTVPGIYSVNHSSSNSHDTFWTNKSNYITAYPPGVIAPVADFTGIPTSGAAPLTVQFTDQSTGFPMSWNWSFGDGSYSTARSPSHLYLVNGTYTVSLNVNNSVGNNYTIQANYITVSTILPVTPTTPSTDSDSSRFVPSTGAATVTGAKAGERITLPFAGNLEADDSIPVVVIAISIVPSIDIQGVMVSAIRAPVGQATKIPGNPPAYYLDINIYWIEEDVIKEEDIRFSVNDGWLKDQGIAPTDLVMARYHNSTWCELLTRMEKYSNGRYYYIATTSGFSSFAVTQKGRGVPTTTPTLISSITNTSQIKTESATIATTQPDTSITAPTEPVTTTTTIPPVSQAGSPEFPMMRIIFSVAGFTGLILGIVFIRRWWIHRQNPALLRKYE